MSDNNNNPQTNPEQNSDDNTQNSIQKEEGQKTTKEVVEKPEPKPEPKAEKPKSSKSKEDNLLYFKNKAKKSEETAEDYKSRLDNIEAELKLTKKTAEVKDVLYNSDINPDFTDLVMDKLLRSDNPAQELQELLEAKPSLKKQVESNKPAGDIGANIGNGNNSSGAKISKEEAQNIVKRGNTVEIIKHQKDINYYKL